MRNFTGPHQTLLRQCCYVNIVCCIWIAELRELYGSRDSFSPLVGEICVQYIKFQIINRKELRKLRNDSPNLLFLFRVKQTSYFLHQNPLLDAPAAYLVIAGAVLWFEGSRVVSIALLSGEIWGLWYKRPIDQHSRPLLAAPAGFLFHSFLHF